MNGHEVRRHERGAYVVRAGEDRDLRGFRGRSAGFSLSVALLGFSIRVAAQLFFLWDEAKRRSREEEKRGKVWVVIDTSGSVHRGFCNSEDRGQ